MKVQHPRTCERKLERGSRTVHEAVAILRDSVKMEQLEFEVHRGEIHNRSYKGEDYGL